MIECQSLEVEAKLCRFFLMLNSRLDGKSYEQYLGTDRDQAEPFRDEYVANLQGGQEAIFLRRSSILYIIL